MAEWVPAVTVLVTERNVRYPLTSGRGSFIVAFDPSGESPGEGPGPGVQCAPVPKPELIRRLPFLSRTRPALDRSTPAYGVGLFRADANVCESHDEGLCDTTAGVYYGCPDDTSTYYCPRHWYQRHFAAGGPDRLIDLRPPPDGGVDTPG